MGKNQLIKEKSIMRKIVVSVLCLALIVSSLAFSGSKVQANTYGPEEFGLGFNVEKYVGIKFQKITKNYVLYKKIKFNGNDGYKYVSNKVYKKKYSKKIKMYTLKNGYPCTWKFMCQGFTYQNLQNKRTDHGSTKAKNVPWIIRGNSMLQYYTP